MSRKKSLLLTCQILGLLINTLATDEKYPVLNRDKITLPIHMQLSEKHKSFCQFFAAILKSIWNFEPFDKNHDHHSFCISEIMNSEDVVRLMPKRSHFRGPFDKQHGKRTQALSKSGLHHLYHIHWSLRSKLSWKKSLL